MEGTPFGRYRLQQLIGRGGMGEVWRAYDTETERVVALKLLPKQFAHDQEFIERFRREARVAAGLNSPNVVPIHHFGEIDGTLYVDMQVIAGRDLQAVLDQGPMPAERAVRVVEQVAAALRAAHAAGLVHRDVKPSNILLNADDFAYLIDFGLARTNDDAGLTVTGHTVGTFAYMAPERYEGGQVDARTDVYSLACVLYQCLTGQRPFPGSGAQQMMGHLTSPIPRPSDVMSYVPRGLDEVIARGMAKDVNARYQTIDEFARAARAAVEPGRTAPQARYDHSYPPTNPTGPAPGLATQAWHTPAPMPAPQSYARPPMVTPVPPRTSWWRRKPVVIGTALLAVVAIAVTAVVLTTSGSTPAAPSETSVAQAPPETFEVGDVTYGALVALPSDGLEGIGNFGVAPDGTLSGRCCLGKYFEVRPLEKPFIESRKVKAYGNGYAVDDQGNEYVDGDEGVLKLTPQRTFSTLPFPPMTLPTVIGLDATGAVYVMDHNKPEGATDSTTQIWKLDFGAPAAVLLPFDDPGGWAMAVDQRGTVYVDDVYGKVILRLDPGSNRPVGLPMVDVVKGMATDRDGALYVLALRNGQRSVALRFPPGSTTGDELPIDNLEWGTAGGTGVAVDSEGNVFVADQATNRIMKLPRIQG